MPGLSVRRETWPLAGSFTISRGSRTTAEPVVVELSVTGDDGRVVRGRGECVTYARYGETVDGVIAAIEGLRPRIEDGLDRIGRGPGAARNGEATGQRPGLVANAQTGHG